MCYEPTASDMYLYARTTPKEYTDYFRKLHDSFDLAPILKRYLLLT